MDELSPKQIKPRRFKIDDDNCQFIVDALIYAPLESDEDIQVARLFYLDMTEIALQDPAYSALRTYAKRTLEKWRHNGELTFD